MIAGSGAAVLWAEVVLRFVVGVGIGLSVAGLILWWVWG